MIKLIPLKQWYCDECGELIEKPEDGYLEWLDDRPEDRRRYGFRIVHHALHSPKRKHGRDCYYEDDRCSSHGSLTSFLGAEGLIHLSGWIDVGEELDDEYKGPDVENLREWTVVLRRLHVPYFEEARQYLSRARSEDYGECNEFSFYSPQTLKEIIDEYGEE